MKNIFCSNSNNKKRWVAITLSHKVPNLWGEPLVVLFFYFFVFRSIFLPMNLYYIEMYLEPELLCLITFPIGIHAALSWKLWSEMFWTCIIMTVVSFTQHTINILWENQLIRYKYVPYALWADRLFAILTIYDRSKYVENKIKFFKKNLFICSVFLILLLDTGCVKDKQQYYFLHFIWHITSFRLLDKHI